MDFDDIDNAERQAHLDHLEEELRKTRIERDKWKQMSMELNDEAKNLRAERDEARGLYCEYVAADNEVTPQDIANAHGWGNINFDRWGVEIL